MVSLTSLSLRADLYLTPGKTSCGTHAELSPWHETIPESDLGLASVNAQQWDHGWGQGNRSLQSGRWFRASHSMVLRRGLLNIFSCMSHVTNYSKVKRLHLWAWILIVVSKIILRAFIFSPKIFCLNCLLHSSCTADRFLDYKPVSYMWLSSINNAGKSVSLLSWD